MDPKTEASPPDEELVRRFRSGDRAAFDMLVLRYRREIYGIAWRITADHGEADDLAQETFCRAYRSLDGFRGESSFRTWLLRIVSNLSLNLVQSARVTRRQDGAVEDLAGTGTAGSVPPEAEDGLKRRERDQRLRQAIARLPGRQKTTLLLRAFEGMPYKEIAKVMGCTIGTARANYFHAVAALRRELEDLI
ncbi:MAG TPA: sigma-70 family RNA polymerase sigma factor [Candidatus Polarisedimenticolia bacterium]|nr:sigma-70 family RNA polymerase sigma factor [Candidatus Polarisedimenticolia bacterium]